LGLRAWGASRVSGEANRAAVMDLEWLGGLAMVAEARVGWLGGRWRLLSAAISGDLWLGRE
jgi:hypothetical protein